MQDQQWNHFRKGLRTDLVARVPARELQSHLSATAGHSLTPEQYGALALIDTDVVVSHGRQYGFGWTSSGFKLFNLVRPVDMVPVSAPRRESETAAA